MKNINKLLNEVENEINRLESSINAIINFQLGQEDNEEIDIIEVNGLLVQDYGVYAEILYLMKIIDRIISLKDHFHHNNYAMAKNDLVEIENIISNLDAKYVQLYDYDTFFEKLKNHLHKINLLSNVKDMQTRK